MARYAIPATNALGIPVDKLRAYAKQRGRDHALALALWKTEIYEARLLATFVDDQRWSQPRRWRAGAATSTAEPSATRPASRCSIGRSSRPESTKGPDAMTPGTATTRSAEVPALRRRPVSFRRRRAREARERRPIG
jgi:hypothetical protein